MDSFIWAGDEESGAEPEWMVIALADGRASIENAGTPEVSLLIGTRRFARGSTIRAEDVED